MTKYYRLFRIICHWVRS